MNREQLREALAAYAHAAWSHWMKYLFSKCVGVTLDANAHPGQPDICGIPPDSESRWRRQMGTEYADLPENEKESDRAEADKMLAILEEHLQGDSK